MRSGRRSALLIAESCKKYPKVRVTKCVNGVRVNFCKAQSKLFRYHLPNRKKFSYSSKKPKIVQLISLKISIPRNQGRRDPQSYADLARKKGGGEEREASNQLLPEW